MSRKHRHECCNDEKEKGFLGNCCCSLPTLIILILILLQFNRRGAYGINAVEGVGGYNGSFGAVDNSILFIIAIFYLTCCNPCKRIGY